MWHHSQQGGSWPLISSYWIDVTECSARVKTGEGTAERKSGGGWEERGGKKKVPWCIWIDKCLFWLLRMELNCRSEETSKHNSGLTSIGRKGRGGGRQCTKAASTALWLRCWFSRAFSRCFTPRYTGRPRNKDSVKVERLRVGPALDQWFPTFFGRRAPTALLEELRYPFIDTTCSKCVYLNLFW